MSAVDGRGFAWTTAVSLLDWTTDTRQKIVNDKRYDPEAPLPPMYHAVLAEAAIYAELAKTDIQVGLYGGDWLERKQTDEREREEMRESLFEKMKERRRPTEGEGE
jgi:hypothetical protein